MLRLDGSAPSQPEGGKISRAGAGVDGGILRGRGQIKGGKTHMESVLWGTLGAKSSPHVAKYAPSGALSPQNVPHLGHFLRKMYPKWGTLRDLVGHIWPGGGAMAPFAPPLYPPLISVC